MAGQVVLQVEPRTVLGKQVKQLRRNGLVPANIYGQHQASQPVQVNAYTLERFLAGHNATHLINLQGVGGDDTQVNTLMRHIARSPRSGKILHVDFMRVSMDELITVRVPVTLKGAAPAVTVEGGVLLHMVDTVEVECLPGDLPEGLELDISSLKDMDDTLFIRDIALPARVKLLSDPDEPVAKAVAPRAVLAGEAAEAAAAPAPETAAPAAEGTAS